MSNGPPQPPVVESGGKPDCPICGGMGFIIPDVSVEHPQFGRAIECTCRETNLEKSRFERLLRISELGSLASCSFDNFLTEGVGLPPAKQMRLSLAYDTVFTNYKEALL